MCMRMCVCVAPPEFSEAHTRHAAGVAPHRLFGSHVDADKFLENMTLVAEVAGERVAGMGMGGGSGEGGHAQLARRALAILGAVEGHAGVVTACQAEVSKPPYKETNNVQRDL